MWFKSLIYDDAQARVKIIAAAPEQTFLEKAFLLHEIFIADGSVETDRKYRHHRELFTQFYSCHVASGTLFCQ